MEGGREKGRKEMEGGRWREEGRREGARREGGREGGREKRGRENGGREGDSHYLLFSISGTEPPNMVMRETPSLLSTPP